jgi:hypothetical protein
MALGVLMRIDKLLEDPGRREHAAMPEADALTDTDALQEATLLEVRLDALRSTVWLLFDCRGAVQFGWGTRRSSLPTECIGLLGCNSREVDSTHGLWSAPNRSLGIGSGRFRSGSFQVAVSNLKQAPPSSS